MPNRFLAAVLAVGLMAVAHGAAAQQKQDPKKQEAKKPEAKQAAHDPQDAIRMCIGCHGIPGYKTAFPDVYHVPKIAGQQPAYIVNALKAYKSGERSHP
ncbi:MAG TPA: hypothetical protein VET51_04815, partial [Burkholderiales bacterium]|nr:hypothetical protein [Burkholderiales bacterium]